MEWNLQPAPISTTIMTAVRPITLRVLRSARLRSGAKSWSWDPLERSSVMGREKSVPLARR
jgi:hypothetical protein